MILAVEISEGMLVVILCVAGFGIGWILADIVKHLGGP